MKTIIAAASLAVATLFTGMAAAQAPVNLPEAGTPVMVTFYDGDGEVLVEGVELDDSAIGSRIDDIDGAEYARLDIGWTSLTLDIEGGGSKHSIYVQLENGQEPTLAELVNDLIAGMEDGWQLTVTTDDDGIVTDYDVAL